MKTTTIALLLFKIAAAFKLETKIENRSGNTIHNMTVSSTRMGVLYPSVSWPSVRYYSESSTKLLSRVMAASFNRFSFTFELRDGSLCYPDHVLDPYEYHGLDDVDQLMTISISRVYEYSGSFIYTIKTTHESVGPVRCTRMSPLQVQFENRSGGPLFNVTFRHENPIHLYDNTPTVFWDTVEDNSNGVSTSFKRYPGFNDIGLGFDTAQGKTCYIYNLWGIVAARETHGLQSDDKLLVVTVRSPSEGEFEYSMQSAHESNGAMKCVTRP